MFFYEVHLAMRWFALAALMALGFSALAQQNIQFSKPVEDDPATKSDVTDFLPDTSRHNPDNFNAPKPLFKMKGPPNSSFDILPGSPPPQATWEAMAQWQKALDIRKNWTLMTQEEILGLPTAEKNLGIADPNDDSKLTVQERYLKRQRRQSEIGASNAWQRADAALRPKNKNDDSPGAIFQSVDKNKNTRFGDSPDGSVPEKSRYSNLLFGQRPDGVTDANQQRPVSLSAWVSPFNMPDLPAKQTPEQLEGMEQFRSLLQGPEKPPQVPVLSPFAAPTPAPNPNMQQFPTFNPAGESFRALGNDISRPQGLTPLPGVTGPRVPPPKKSAPLVQPPPWMQNSFQNPTLPQRQF